MARAKKDIGLQGPKELRSNSLQDIQEFLQRWKDELDRTYRLVLSDITTVQIGSGTTGNFLYFGDADTDGSWRIGKSGADYVLEHRDSGVWTNVKLNPGT